MEENYSQYCQSCALPMGDTAEMFGTELDGNINHDYCSYCYENGTFINDCTMEEMIEICVPHMTASNEEMSENTARDMLKEFFPQIKRWK